MTMRMIRIISLAVFLGSQFQGGFIVDAQNDSWPDCGPYDDDYGYPIGCKSSIYDVCARQSEECKTLVCNKEVISKALKACDEACINRTFPINVTEAGEYNCWCSPVAEPICLDEATRLERIPHLDIFPQQETNIQTGRGGGVQLKWGMVQIPSEELMPVFCNSNTRCEPIIKIDCVPCPEDLSMCKENYYSLLIYQGSPDTTCGNYRLAAFELRSELNDFMLLFNPATTIADSKIATSSMVLAGESTQIWYGWDIPFTGLVLKLGFNIQNKDQFIRVEFFSDSIKMGWSFSRTNDETVRFAACQLGGREACWDCVKVDQYGNQWRCCDNTNCERKCPLRAGGDAAYWKCDGDEYSTMWPEYEGCISAWISEIQDMIGNQTASPFNLMMALVQYVTDSTIFGHEIKTVVDLTHVALDILLEEQDKGLPASQLSELKIFSDFAMGVIDNFFALTIPWQQLGENETMALRYEIQNLADTYGFSFTNKTKFYSHETDLKNITSIKKHFLMEAQYLQRKEGKILGDIIRFPIRGTKKLTSMIVVKQLSIFSNTTETIDLEAVGQIIPMAVAEKLYPGKRNSFHDAKKKLNSELIRLTILYGPDRTLIEEYDSDSSVLIIFKHNRQIKGPLYETIWHELYPGEKETAIKGTQKCAFLNNETSEWETEGCQIVKSGNWHTECECKHTGPYALLSDVHEYAKDIIMEIISIIFSSLSVVSLALTLIALNFVEGSQEERNSIEKHLCFCLLIGHGMALTVLDRSYFHLSQEVCVGVAIFLHYIFLAAFMWMAVEGHLLYRMVVRVFDSGRDFSMIYLCSSYGIPLLVVSITCAITASLQDYGYANDELCWLSTPFYIWAFMGPVVILTGINLVVLVFAMKVAVAASAQQMHSFSERMKIWMKGWFSLSSLLGVTWIFGFFYIQFDHNFAYAFVTLNGLQGIIMFLTRVVFNEQVKSSIKSKAKQKIMMKSFYNFVWNRKDSNAKTSPQPSPWVSRNSLQPNEACSASAIRFGDTTSRCRSSTKHSLSNDSSISTIDSKQNVNPFRPMTSNDSQTLLKIKMKIQNSWGFLRYENESSECKHCKNLFRRETLLHKNNIEIIVKDFSFKNDVENVEEQNIEC